MLTITGKTRSVGMTFLNNGTKWIFQWLNIFQKVWMNHVDDDGFSWMPLKRGRWPKQIHFCNHGQHCRIGALKRGGSLRLVCLSVWAARRPITVIYDPSSDDSEECIRKLDMQSIGTSVRRLVVRSHKKREKERWYIAGKNFYPLPMKVERISGIATSWSTHACDGKQSNWTITIILCPTRSGSCWTRIRSKI